MFDIPPDPIAFTLGPLNIGWYGICYAVGLAAAYLVMVRLARLAGEDPDVVGNGIIIVAIAALMQVAGLSMALGAFLAGVLLAESEYRRELETDIEPFKGLLLGLFFIAVGMSIDFGVLIGSPAAPTTTRTGMPSAAAALPAAPGSEPTTSRQARPAARRALATATHSVAGTDPSAPTTTATTVGTGSAAGGVRGMGGQGNRRRVVVLVVPRSFGR